MKAKIILSIVFASLFLSSCSSTNKLKHEELQKLVREGNFTKGLDLVKSKDFYPEKESRLLKVLELGSLNYFNGNYFQALQNFDEAQDLSDKLFTVSISKKVVSAISNDTMDNYYGEKYERSLIRFYQVLTHFALSEAQKYEGYNIVEKGPKGEDVVKPVPEKPLDDKMRRFHLMAARSVLIEWNSLLDNYKSMSGGKPTYKDDLMAKLFGAFIHERLGSMNDLQIAKNLYVEAKKVLLRNFAIYSTYNKKNKDFISKFDKFHTMNERDVLNSFVQKSENYLGLEKFIDGKIASFGKKDADNVHFLISNKFVAPKKARKFEFPLPVDAIPKTVTNVGGFVGFAGRILKAGKNALPKIYFELPAISYKNDNETIAAVIKTKDGQVISRIDTVLVDPLSEIASYTLDEESTSNYAKVGARVATKHLAALVAAYLIYEKQKGSSDLVAFALATASYTAANKAIEMSERADLRFWATLPSEYRLTSTKLNPGDYKIEVVKFVEGKEVLVTTKDFSVSKDKSKMVNLLAL